MQRNHRAVLRLTASIHTKEQQTADITILHRGINKQCHKGTQANASLDGDIIDGALMRIRLHNLRQTPGLHGFCQSAVTMTERLSTILKTNPSPNKPPLPQGFLPCSALAAATPNHLSLFVLFTC